MYFDESIVYTLDSPCGIIEVLGSSGSRVPFSVRPSGSDTEFEADSGQVYDTPHKYIITISAEELQLERDYCIRLDGIPLSVGASDECYQCVVGSGNGCSIAIGASDPNEPEKLYQLAQQLPYGEKPAYFITCEYNFDRRSFTRYDLKLLRDYSGFRFRLLDSCCEEIVFTAAWIDSLPGLEDETESAVQFWVM